MNLPFDVHAHFVGKPDQSMPHKCDAPSLRSRTEISNFHLSVTQILRVVFRSCPSLWSNTLPETFSVREFDVEASINPHISKESNVQER